MVTKKKLEVITCVSPDCREVLANRAGKGRSLKYCPHHGEMVKEVQIKRGVASQRVSNEAKKAMLSSDEILQLAHDQAWKCAVTGIKFEFKKPENRHANPWSLSLDRIDPKGGYVAGNVRLVVWVYNLVKNDWTDAETEQHLHAMLAKICRFKENGYLWAQADCGTGT